MTVNYSVNYTGGTNTPFGFKNKYNATDYNNPKSKGTVLKTNQNSP